MYADLSVYCQSLSRFFGSLDFSRSQPVIMPAAIV
jgi:hypothetical protein